MINLKSLYFISTFGPKEAAAINQLATGIKKIRNRSAANESMEMMTFFLEDVKRKDPDMADAMRPFVEQYLATRKDVNITDFLPQNFNEEGFVNFPEDDIMEQWLDEEELKKMEEEAAAGAVPVATASSSSSNGEHSSSPSDNKDLDDDSDHLDGGTPVTPTKPRFTPPSPHNLPSLADYKTPSQARKLSAQLEKQLTEYLKHQNKTAA